MTVHDWIAAATLAALAGLLAAAFGADDLAALRRWRIRWRVRRYTTAFYRDGVDLAFAMHRLAATRPDRRIRTYPRHRLHGGRA